MPDPAPPDSAEPPARGPSRRALLGGAVTGWGAAVALGVGVITRAGGAGEPAPAQTSPAPRSDPTGATGDAVVPFHGAHQAGVGVVPQAHSVYLALDLAEATTAADLRRLMRLLTSDAERLTRGLGALADTEPELALHPARLTVTFGFGPRVHDIVGGAVRAWPTALPPFRIDRLQAAWSGGDLLIEVAADDPLTVAHAQRMLLKDARTFARPRWVQAGFRRADGIEPRGTTMRNLFGQVDGTANPRLGTADFDDLVWITEGPLTGGTSLVIRRIAMHLETWDEVDRIGRESAVGRRLDTGAPLTGTREEDEPDLAATDRLGFPVIPTESHLRRARHRTPRERFYRRGFNYDEPPAAGQTSNSGLVFTTYQADPATQFVPVQRRLDELDILNTWTTPIGSAVFAVPPGCAEGGYIGETLLA